MLVHPHFNLCLPTGTAYYNSYEALNVSYFARFYLKKVEKANKYTMT